MRFGTLQRPFYEMFDAIRALMREKKSAKREIGFHTLMKPTTKSSGAKAKKI